MQRVRKDMVQTFFSEKRKKSKIQKRKKIKSGRIVFCIFVLLFMCHRIASNSVYFASKRMKCVFGIVYGFVS